MKAALEYAGLSVNAAARALQERHGVRVSQSQLSNIVLGYAATTRRSVHGGLAALCGVSTEYLAGFGPDRNAVELMAHQIADYPWDEDREVKIAPPGDRSVADLHRRFTDWKQRKEESTVRERELALLAILDLDRWVQRLGDPRTAEVSEEARTKFAIHLGRALRIATTHPIKERQRGEERTLEAEAKRQPHPRAEGLRALHEWLKNPT